MAGKGASVESVDQILDADMQIADFVTRPERIRRWFTNNILRRMLSYLVGWTGIEFKALRCTVAGILQVSDVGGGVLSSEGFAGNATGGSTTHSFVSDTVGLLMVSIWDNPAVFRFSPDTVNYSYGMELEADMVYEIVCDAKKVSITNKVALNVARYEIVGFRREV